MKEMLERHLASGAEATILVTKARCLHLFLFLCSCSRLVCRHAVLPLCMLRCTVWGGRPTILVTKARCSHPLLLPLACLAGQASNPPSRCAPVFLHPVPLLPCPAFPLLPRPAGQRPFQVRRGGDGRTNEGGAVCGEAAGGRSAAFEILREPGLRLWCRVCPGWSCGGVSQRAGWRGEHMQALWAEGVVETPQAG